MTLLTVKSVHKSYARTEALRGVSLQLDPGEIVAVSGASGSGKSTLLHCAAGVLRPESGEIWFDGRRTDQAGEAERAALRRREIGLILQFGQLVPELSAVTNVALPLLLDGVERKVAQRSALGWLERLDAVALAEQRPVEMSGGECQRVAMARALITGPRLVCADEPTGALDTVAGERVLAELLRVVRETGAALLMVTHDNRVAARADREVVMSDGRLDAAAVAS